MRLHIPAEEEIQAFSCGETNFSPRTVSAPPGCDAVVAQALLDPELNCDYKKEQTFTSGFAD
jgi:hypothetical protein